MSGIFGWINHETSIEDSAPDILKKMSGNDETKSSVMTHLFGKKSAMAGPTEKTLFHKEENLLIGLFSPYLSDNNFIKKDTIIPKLIDIYRSTGRLEINELHGPFVAVLIDEQKSEAFLANDRLGMRNIVYSTNNNRLVFGPNAKSICRHPYTKVDINLQGIYNYLHFHMVPSPDTVFQSIHRCAPASLIHYKKGKFTVYPYWKIDFQEHSTTSFGNLKDEFMEILEQSTKRVYAGNNVGAFLSGGTDSSTITGMLGRIGDSPARTYSIGFGAQGYDETEYAQTTARYFNADHHEYYVTPEDVVTAIPIIAKAYSQPFGNASAVPTFYCAKFAQNDGIKRLLGGDGGDELFGGNSRYATQRLFSLYELIPNIIRKPILEPAFSGIPGLSKIPLLRKVKSYIEQAKIPMPERIESYNLLNRIGIENILMTSFLEQINPHLPITLLEDVYHATQAKALINKMLNLDIKFTLADNDLPKVTTICESIGMEVAYPLLDEQLLEFSARLAPNMK